MQFIARMDADDICEPNRFETQISFLIAHPGIYFVFIAFFVFVVARTKKLTNFCFLFLKNRY